MSQLIVTYLRVSALRTVYLPPRANVSAKRTRRTNAFAVVNSDKTGDAAFCHITLDACFCVTAQFFL